MGSSRKWWQGSGRVSKNLERQLVALRAKKTTFDKFVHATRVDYERMALYLLRRWNTPSWYSTEDVEQELYMGTWKHIGSYQPGRGPSLKSFVVFNAMAWAKRQLHKARGAKSGVDEKGEKLTSPDFIPSNFEATFSSGIFGSTAALMQANLDAVFQEEAVAEAALIEHESRTIALQKAIEACENPKEEAAFLAIRDAGSLDDAAYMLYYNIDDRIAFRLHSEEHAERFVYRQAHAVVDRLTSL